MESSIRLRTQQEKISNYSKGWMGVSAVPGSGKTHTLSYLAAQLIGRGLLREDQEVLIVTLVNSAVENFNQRIGMFVQSMGLFPNLGYRVRTLHGLAHDILRERPDLAGLSDQFQILDESETSEIVQNAVQKWDHLHPEFKEEYLSKEYSLRSPQIQKNWGDWLVDLNRSFIRYAKDHEIHPQDIQAFMERYNAKSLLMEMGLEVYRDYQRALSFRSGVDFDDLVRLALISLRSDVSYLKSLQYRWPYILEDEAQDSNLLQEKILRLLAGEQGNWVRVGDPNQAIYETFTTASPQYLINFLMEPGVQRCDLPVSGRSTKSLQNLANFLIKWSRSEENPNPDLRNALQLPYILPTMPDDPQPNPPDETTRIFFSTHPYKPDEEVEVVVNNIKAWIKNNPDKTIAVLVPRNDRGSNMIDELRRQGVDCVDDLLRLSQKTRTTANCLAAILKAIDEPGSSAKLANAYKNIKQVSSLSSEEETMLKTTVNLISKCNRIEDFLYPQPDRDWLDTLQGNIHPEIYVELSRFREKMIKWQAASLLPIDQFILIISLDLFEQPHDLALAHKIALWMERTSQNHPDWVLPNFIVELDSIITQKKNFSGFTAAELGFNPDHYPGKVVVSTIHKAKGLEWDRVHIVSANNYDFPMALPGENFIAERWFIKEQQNLEAILLNQLEAIQNNDGIAFFDQETPCWKARVDYAAERLRLLYVAITRAKTELIVTWNTGKRGDCKPSAAFQALQSYLSKANEHSD